ncbi:ABC transporter ATP-binding protein [Hyperthermus butylicus]|uniref:Ribose ABC transporter ATP-binding protein, RbsA-1 n=1 Tax=Hyperthermus butylicus (strain DSM 5456 / JCM 9403 / PLM1-5) TaxID=415426 RepID=A2BJ12_HYPBU|nr:ABC transporter ATP-binding protein [Hyperthermus butylicus]ABM79973.1 ribose ABC transporter ATP-binding protein, RbsA-1 [Hyperthermus butylicus DSM 5456]
MGKAAPVLSLHGIVKVYPGGVVANDHVDLDLYPGEVLALLGENGAGKSTLVSIIAGLQRPDHGRIIYRGSEVQFGSPRDAVRAGIVLVPQHPRLIEAFTVAENVMLAVRLAGRKLSRSEVVSRLQQLAEKYGLHVDPDKPVRELTMGERQRAEILKALLLDAQVLLLDEPTTHLSPLEARQLLGLARRLAGEGRSVVLITHRIPEALEAADRIAVMRRGKLVTVMPRSEATPAKLLQLMFGEAPRMEVKRSAKPGSREVLVVRDVWISEPGRGYVVKAAAFSVRSGEIYGIAGVAGNGQRELFEAIIGLRIPVRGSIIIDGVDVTRRGAGARARLGTAVIPEERLGWALVPGKSLVFNTVLGFYSCGTSLFRGLVVLWSRARRLTEKIVEDMEVKTPGLDASVEALSGGNMQRFILGRELAKKPRLIVAMNPTAGLDFDATRRVRRLIARAADEGAAVLLVSEDLEELFELADRIAVMSAGRIVCECSKPFNYKHIVSAMAQGGGSVET